MIKTKLTRLTREGAVAVASEMGLDYEQYAELLQVMNRRVDEGLEELLNAIDAGDDETAERAIHSIKGTALNMRLEMIADPAAVVENLIRGGDKKSAAEKLDELKVTLDEFRKDAISLGIIDEN